MLAYVEEIFYINKKFSNCHKKTQGQKSQKPLLAFNML